MVRFFHVGRSYPGREVLVDVDLEIERGCLLFVSGVAGAGKTTLVRLLLGLDSVRRGWITVDGVVLGSSSTRLLAAHRRRIAIIAQDAPLVGDLSATENVALGLEVAGASGATARHEAELTLERLGRSDLGSRRVRSLSRSEQQWVALARGLARTEAPLVVADEPADGLDPAAALIVGGLLAEEHARGKTVLVLSRARSLAGAEPTRSFDLELGRMCERTAQLGQRRVS